MTKIKHPLGALFLLIFFSLARDFLMFFKKVLEIRVKLLNSK